MQLEEYLKAEKPDLYSMVSKRAKDTGLGIYEWARDCAVRYLTKEEQQKLLRKFPDIMSPSELEALTYEMASICAGNEELAGIVEGFANISEDLASEREYREAFSTFIERLKGYPGMDAYSEEQLTYVWERLNLGVFKTERRGTMGRPKIKETWVGALPSDRELVNSLVVRKLTKSLQTSESPSEARIRLNRIVEQLRGEQ